MKKWLCLLLISVLVSELGFSQQYVITAEEIERIREVNRKQVEYVQRLNEIVQRDAELLRKQERAVRRWKTYSLLSSTALLTTLAILAAKDKDN